METARPATPDDVARIADLAREERAELAEYRGGALWATREVAGEPLVEHVTELLTRDDARVIVGCIDDVVVGFGTVLVEQLRDGTHLGVVTDLYVEPDARSVGVGEAIANALERALPGGAVHRDRRRRAAGSPGGEELLRGAGLHRARDRHAPFAPRPRSDGPGVTPE